MLNLLLQRLLGVDGAPGEHREARFPSAYVAGRGSQAGPPRHHTLPPFAGRFARERLPAGIRIRLQEKRVQGINSQLPGPMQRVERGKRAVEHHGYAVALQCRRPTIQLDVHLFASFGPIDASVHARRMRTRAQQFCRTTSVRSRPPGAWASATESVVLPVPDSPPTTSTSGRSHGAAYWSASARCRWASFVVVSRASPWSWSRATPRLLPVRRRDRTCRKPTTQALAGRQSAADSSAANGVRPSRAQSNRIPPLKKRVRRPRRLREARPTEPK